MRLAVAVDQNVFLVDEQQVVQLADEPGDFRIARRVEAACVEPEEIVIPSGRRHKNTKQARSSPHALARTRDARCL